MEINYSRKNFVFIISNLSCDALLLLAKFQNFVLQTP